MRHEAFDLLIVGSGAAGLVAAVRGATQGARVLVVEKGALWGGTSATSGGGIWIPGSNLAAAAGHPDDPESAFAYIRALTADNVTDDQIRGFVDGAPRMLDWIGRAIGIGYVPLPYPDYYPEVAGARTGYRTHLPTDYHASRMRRAAFDTMQRASPAASLWGRINWNFAETNVVLFRPKGWAKILMKVMASYWLDFPQRLRSPRDRRLTLGTALLGQLRTALDDAGGQLWLDTRLSSLTMAGGRVTGAVVEQSGEPVQISARRGVILAAGGFERNRARRAAHLRSDADPAASGSQVNNTGDMLDIAGAVGAATRNLDAAWWAPVLRIPGEERARLSTIERALPHSLVVNQAGLRYVNEALAYHRFGEAMATSSVAGAGTEPSWIVFDSTYRARYPMGPILPGVPDALLPRAARETLRKGATIAALAGRIGVPAGALSATVARFNDFARRGKDEDFHRGDADYDRLYGDPRHAPNPTLGTIEKGPFYAMPLYLGDIGTSGGLVTDERAHVLRADDTPIAGLYAVGNCAGSVMGYSYPGAGATLGPGMTFGYLAAMDALGINDDNA
ncbi:FAD-dependent oxidoreductase [Sphingomonas sp. TDK1]|uniref:FAD-dependent oxidoreductase n=1 Tax=Sphingomonas sp. TDK1 TaxID=453247 RepID=UPI0007DA320A|nr:FAD-dependent oxidoreductase [Sphingomonas sp. TDK1]OAN66678.1 fumarate reductase [Sphingomonas sp. TDK1]